MGELQVCNHRDDFADTPVKAVKKSNSHVSNMNVSLEGGAYIRKKTKTKRYMKSETAVISCFLTTGTKRTIWGISSMLLKW